MNKIIGIDISKQDFDAAFSVDSKWHHRKYSNDLKGFKQLSKCLEPGDWVLMEASGPYYLRLASFLYQNGIKISVINPLIIRRYSQSRLQRAKTDKKDAQTIAEYGQHYELKAWQPEERTISQLKQYQTALTLLEKQIHQTKRQLGAFKETNLMCVDLRKILKQNIRSMEKKKAQLEKQIDQIAKAKYQQSIKKLESIPGIGKKTAIMLIVITNNFENFESYKQLIAYVGLSPRIFQSGTSVKGKSHICKMGKSQVRKLLYMCSWSAKRCNKGCREMYERLSAKGKPERVIKVALANKLLKQAFAIGKGNTIYNENYVSNPCF